MENKHFYEKIADAVTLLEKMKKITDVMAVILSRMTGCSCNAFDFSFTDSKLLVYFMFIPSLPSKEIDMLKRAIPSIEFFGDYVTIPLNEFFNL
jgi:hypothetical protein